MPTNEFMLLVKVSRPFVWVIAPLIFLIGLFYAGAKLTFLPALQILLLSFPYCILLYGINDIYDYRSDKLNPRKKLIEGVKLAPEHHPFIKKASIFVALLFASVSFLTLNATNILGMLLLLFFSYFYSAPPLRFKVRSPLDSFSNGIIYFFAPFSMGYSFGGTFFAIPIKIYIVSVVVMAIHSFSTIMDYSVDKKAGDTTFSVAFGKRAGSAFLLLASFIALVFGGIKTVAWHYYLIFLAIVSSITFVFQSEKLASLFLKIMVAGFVLASMAYLGRW